MAPILSRRTALKGERGRARRALSRRGFGIARADGEIETHGLSSFGELALPADFKHFAYVNPDAPKGGLLSVQITDTGGNQNFDTFDTLNIYSTKGDGAAGMSAMFRHADGRQRRRAGFGLWAARRLRALQRRQARLPFHAAPGGAFRRRLEADRGGRRLLARHPQDQGSSDLRRAARRSRERVEAGER